MRPGQNRRMRGRSRNKGPNPLTRSYESNGPDVKVRGTAQHVADKYAQLARDAQVSGDPVAAENYFQHAEHYYRLIATAQEALRQQYGGTGQDDGDDDGDEGMSTGYYPGERQGPPPVQEDSDYGMPQQQQPYDVPRGSERNNQPRYDRNGERPTGQDRSQEQRPGFDRNNQQRFDRNGGGERFDRNARAPDNGPRYDNNRNGNGNDQPRRERYPRNDQPRQDYARDNGRQESPRQDGGRQDGPRQEGSRQDGSRQDYGRDAARHEAPRQDGPRRDFQREEREEPREAAAAALPAFLTNPVRTPIAFGDEPIRAAADADATDESHAEANGFAPERPRRRTRARRPVAEEGNAPDLAGDDAPAE